MSERLNVINDEIFATNPPQTLKIPQPNEAWFSSGLRFKCTGCGQCCTGAPGYVWVTELEAEKIAQYKNMPVDDFRRKYVRRVGDRDSLVEDSKTYDCAFLKDKKCQIYPVRPKQCRTFPWWQHNLQSEAEWNEAGKYCEGINHPDAPLVPAETVCQQLTEHEKK
ncbi:MAG: YkgJ family cysteine cluster protein [Parachlamydiaceae bacterium]|nr:YkgJ family cysteine cluster protein [Parachlamydiaceae bacterium]